MVSEKQKNSQDLIDKIKKELSIHEGNYDKVRQIRKIDNGGMILDTDHLNGNSITEITEEITAVKANVEKMVLLDMHNYDLLVCDKLYTYLEDVSLFQYPISKHCPEKFRFVDFTRQAQL